MEKKRCNIAVVAHAGGSKYAFTGGALRAGRSIREYSKYFNIQLLLPPTYDLKNRYTLEDLKSELGVSNVVLLKARLKPVLTHSQLDFTYLLLPQRALSLLLEGFEDVAAKPELVVVLNENPECLKIGCMLKQRHDVPAIAILQLPVFYHDKRRRENIARAFKLWYEELYREEKFTQFVKSTVKKLCLAVNHSKLMKSVLEKYDALVAVSRSIPYEMGPEWAGKIRVLDPGVGFDEGDLELLARARESSPKQNYVIFGGRVDALKGFIEGLYVFKELAKRNSSLKLVVTGYVGEVLNARIRRLLKKLEMEDRVVLTGVIPRSERFALVAGSKLMIYPSHVDSFSYAVSESLYLGTPVVAYDIPALKMYYGENPGVKLVREGDVEALATEACNVLESREVHVERPVFRSWSDIMREEVELITRLLNA